MTSSKEEPVLDKITPAIASLNLSPPESSLTPTHRRPYHGSCHCGHTRYIAYLTLPPPVIHAKPPGGPSTTVRLRKCNCSTCHKMGVFHVRLMSSPDDFMLLSPLDPTSGGLLDYTCFDRIIHWFFCGTCGVRCFAWMGEGEVREVDGLDGVGEKGEKVRVWRPKREGWLENQTGYLSVNATTLEPGQEGLDLREWTDRGWIAYLDCKNEAEEDRLGKPHEGGMY